MRHSSRQGQGAPGADHAEGAAGIIAKVAARELPRDAGVALLVSSMGMAAEGSRGCDGRGGAETSSPAPDPAAVDRLAALQAENAKLRRANRGARRSPRG